MCNLLLLYKLRKEFITKIKETIHKVQKKEGIGTRSTAKNDNYDDIDLTILQMRTSP